MASPKRSQSPTANVLARQISFDVYASRQATPSTFVEPRVVCRFSDGSQADVVAVGPMDVEDLLDSLDCSILADSSKVPAAVGLAAYLASEWWEQEAVLTVAVDDAESVGAWAVPIHRNGNGEPSFRRPVLWQVDDESWVVSALHAWLFDLGEAAF